MLEARTVGEALLLMRHRSGLRRDDVADLAGVAAGTLSRYERDLARSPQAHLLRQIIDVLAAKLGEDADAAWSEVGSLIGAEARRRTNGQGEASRARDPRRTIVLDAVEGDSADDAERRLTG